VGVNWAFGEPRPEELDAALLVWKIHQRINCDLLPDTRTVVEFDLRARAEGGCGWCSSAVRCPSASRRPDSIPT
jgi:hypothetical protein